MSPSASTVKVSILALLIVLVLRLRLLLEGSHLLDNLLGNPDSPGRSLLATGLEHGGANPLILDLHAGFPQQLIRLVP